MSRGAAQAGGLALLTCAACLPGSATAGAWVQPKGQAQVIVKYEDMVADRGFDPDGAQADLPARRRDRSAGIFAEYGVTDRLTLQLKGDWQDGYDAFVDYQGRGPIEIGATWQVWRNDAAALSVYGGYAQSGPGRNAGYAAPGVGDHDWEAGCPPVVRSVLQAPGAGGRIARSPKSRWRGGCATVCPTRRGPMSPWGGISVHTGCCWARPMVG